MTNGGLGAAQSQALVENDVAEGVVAVGMTTTEAWLNGAYIDSNEVKFDWKDRGLRLSDAVFDVCRTFNGNSFRLRDHLERLYRSLKYVRIDPGLGIDEMERLTLEIVDRNEPVRRRDTDWYITHLVTRGEGTRAHEAANPTVAIWLDEITWSRFAPLYASGVHLVITRYRALSSDQLEPKIKHTNRLHYVLAELAATDVSPDAYALLLDERGNLNDAYNIGNVFLVTDGVVRTPTDDSLLQGVSRLNTLELARTLGMPAFEEDLQPYDIYNADEVFVTSTTYCICPVSRVDNRMIGREVPGNVTKRLTAAWSEMVGLDIVQQIQEQALIERARQTGSVSGDVRGVGAA